MTGNDNKATSWEGDVAKTFMTTPRASSPYPDQPGTMEQLESDTEDDIIDITDYAERPPNDKRLPQHTPKYRPHSVTQGHCSTPQTSPSYLAMNVTTVHAKPHHMETGESSQTKEEHPTDGPHV